MLKNVELHKLREMTIKIGVVLWEKDIEQICPHRKNEENTRKNKGNPKFEIPTSIEIFRKYIIRRKIGGDNKEW